MSRKRTLIPDIYKQKKRVCTNPGSQPNGLVETKNKDAPESPSGTKTSLLYIRSLFPTEKFEHRLPPIILQHQLYSILKSRAVIDRQINEMRLSGEVKVFKSGADSEEHMVVFTDDFRRHVQCVLTEANVSKETTEKYVKTVIAQCSDVSIDRDTLENKYKFTESELTQLIKASVLTVRDVDTWWFSVPNSGIFMKSFTRGRKAVITMIKKCKYREIFRDDLEQRKWPKIAKLGLLYHVHDIIGADLVECIQTTSGQLLRLKE